MTKPLFIVLAISVTSILAFPPAPHHEVFGTIRDEHGNPLTGEATVTFSGTDGDILTGLVDPSIAVGVNYSMKVPMDAGSRAGLYKSTALQPAMPFTASVRMGGTSYVPIEIQGGGLSIGDPGGRTRLDLTLGVDSDGDGLPDSWENDIIEAIDGIETLAEVTKDGDADRDGVSNYLEYLAGTYAFDERTVFRLEIVAVADGQARLRFLAVTGRHYALLAGTRGNDFAPIPFAVTSDPEAETQSDLYADSIRYQDIYVPAELVGTQLFRLSVQ